MPVHRFRAECVTLADYQLSLREKQIPSPGPSSCWRYLRVGEDGPESLVDFVLLPLVLVLAALFGETGPLLAAGGNKLPRILHQKN